MANRGSYPHPVIDSSDDVGSEFEVVNVLVDPAQQDIEIFYEVRTDDPDIRRMIDEGCAMHSLRWHCSATISTGELWPQEVQRTPKGVRLKAWIDQQWIKGDVVAEVRVIASQRIKGHRWIRQHSDYGDAYFDIHKGDVLAEGGSFRFNAEKRYDPLDPPIGSCFRFVRSAAQNKNISVRFEGDETVDVLIPAQTFDDFKLFAHRPDMQIALVVLPALLETLDFIKTNKEEEPLGDKAWYLAISALVNENGGWDQSLLKLAQRILESPLDRAIRQGLSLEEDD